MPDSKFFGIPFGTSGDKATIPEAAQPSGAISFQQGFGPDYERDPGTDPLAKRVPRDETNELYFQITNALKYLQLYGLPEWYDEDDSGAPVSYPLGARVRYNDNAWISAVGSNTTTPGTGASWVRDDVYLQTSRVPWVPVISLTLTTPPASPAVGDAYIVPTGATGIWASQVGKLAEFTSSGWVYTTTPAGHGVSDPGSRVYTKVGSTYSQLSATEVLRGLVLLASDLDAQNGTGGGVVQSSQLSFYARRLPTIANFYVRTDGNDNNNGSANNAANAFATPQGAIDYIAARISSGIAIVNVASGSYPKIVRPGGTSVEIRFVGNPANPSLVSITAPSGQIAVTAFSGLTTFDGFRIAGPAGGFFAARGGNIEIQNITFAINTSINISTEVGGVIRVTGALEVGGGNMRFHAYIRGGGFIDLRGGNVRIVNSATLNDAFIGIYGPGYIESGSETYTLVGSVNVTGARFNVAANGVLNSSASAAGYYPGSTPGVTSTGGIYV